jgi:hypothetical protein
MGLPEDGHKYEMVDGEAKAAPTGQRHAFITGWLILLFMPYARGRGPRLRR